MVAELYLMFILSFANNVLNDNELENIKNIFIGKRIALTENRPIYMEYNNASSTNTSVLSDTEKKTHLERLIPNKKSNNSLLDNIVGRENDYFLKRARSKRNVFDLYNMIDCATGCNPLIYKGYGCYCGFLGSGYAVDGIDRCCKQHDWCYNSTNCPLFFQYFVPYHWKCYNNRGFCASSHTGWNYLDLCAKSLCECDRLLTECLRQFPCPTSFAVY